MLTKRLAAAAIVTATMAVPALAAGDIHAGTADHATMVIGQMPVMTLVPVGHYSAFDRIAEVQRRLIRFLAIEKPNAFARQPAGVEGYKPDIDLAIAWHPGAPIVTYKGFPLVTITAPDAAAQAMSQEAMATAVLTNLRRSLAESAPSQAPSLSKALRQIAIRSDDRSYSASEQRLDEGS